MLCKLRVKYFSIFNFQFSIKLYLCIVQYKYATIMATAVKKQPASAAKRTQPAVPQNGEQPKRLSKAGQWMRDNPHGIGKVIDWRAVNK
jgi:hypothetical protein